MHVEDDEQPIDQEGLNEGIFEEQNILTTIRDDPPHPETIDLHIISQYTSPPKSEEAKIQDQVSQILNAYNQIMSVKKSGGSEGNVDISGFQSMTKALNQHFLSNGSYKQTPNIMGTERLR